MAGELLIRYFHFVSILATVGTLMAEWLMVGRVHTRSELAKLARIDLAYGIASLALVTAGLTLWLGGVGKPAAFYSGNPVFNLKIILAVAVGILSLPPTFFFIRERKGEESQIVQVPPYVRRCIQAELAILSIVPLLAVLMAKGVGY